MAKKVSLGQACLKEIGVAEIKEKMSDEERLIVLEQQVAYLINLITALRARVKRESEEIYQGLPLEAPHGLNKDGLPVGLVCIGETSGNRFPTCLVIEKDHYEIGQTKYLSLSAAAEATSGIRRSGCSFWKLPDGRTLKEATGRK